MLGRFKRVVFLASDGFLSSQSVPMAVTSCLFAFDATATREYVTPPSLSVGIG
jgi:hypothetical protein